MEKYIIALDLDETLLDSKMNISTYTKETLKKCKEKGMIVAISSTRGYGSCKNIAKEIEADYCCVQSGNSIVDANGNIIYNNAFSKEAVANFIKEFPEYVSNFLVDSDENLYGNSTEKVMSIWKAIPCTIEDILNLNVYKMCVHYEPEYQQIIENYCKEHGFVCRPMRTDSFLLITPPNSDKFYALEKLLSLHKTDLNHLIVFGDDNSDSLSIERAKYGVAVQNAREAVLEIAKYVTSSNDEDGVATFLNKFIDENM